MRSEDMPKLIENRIADLIAAKIDKAGYELVRVYLSGAGQYANLQVMAERQDGVGMTVEDCALISRAVSETLEADKELADRYDLEVSSPGIDRPLIKLKDYVRYQGHSAKIELETAIEGQRRFEGTIRQASSEGIEFDTDKGALRVPLASIEKAKLVMTDALLKAAQKGKVSH